MFKVEPLPLRPLGTAAPPAPPPQLPVGSVFAVEAVRDTASQQLLLLLAGRKWLLKPGGAASEVQPGSRLQVRVLRTEPELELALVARSSDVATALRREVPQQASPLRLLANLDWLMRRSPDAAAQLPDTVRAALDAAWRSVPARAQLTTAAGLEAACRDSGLRLESQLAAAPSGELAQSLPADWKAVLYRLQATLARAGAGSSAPLSERSDAPLPTRHGPLNALAPEVATLVDTGDPRSMLGELAQQVRESIARVACNQLASLDRHEQAALPLLLEVPYREATGTGLLRLRIEREAAAAEAACGAVWTIELALDLGAEGPLRGRVTLVDGRVSVTLQPESASLAGAIDARVDELRDTLQDAGVPIGKLTCVRSDPLAAGVGSAWLVNLRA